MRIIGGAWRGRSLAAPDGARTRPTSDRAREGLFSMLASRIGSFEGLRVADLFAGTGALGLEALSRGAAHCTFIESDRAAAAILRRNIDHVGAGERAALLVQPVEYATPPPAPLDIALLDPPYGTGLAAMALSRIANPGWLVPGAFVSIETDGTRPDLPQGLSVEAERRFGKAHILLLRG
jgi:16S rRNA (guanine966-N2)-methyltransferase